MGNENLLPKNIRQIGEIQGRQKICLEDYVVTYIRKIESRGDESFLGIFLGERKNTEQTDYVFVRGLMEVPDTKEQKSRKTAADGMNTSGQGGTTAGENAKIRNRKDAGMDGVVDAHFDGKQVAAERMEEDEAADEDITKEKISLWEAFQRRYGTQEAGNTEKGEKEEKEEKEAKKANEARNIKKAREAKEARKASDAMPDESLNAQERNCTDSADPAVEPQDIWEQLRKELEERFPGCEILGCCVIGVYPAGRTEELSSHFPEAGQMLYHLQDQEERLYWRDGGRYEGVKGYFVFYEQNRQMQAYLAETFGGASVEKEKVPDEAIRSFREKIKSKAEERSRSFLKLASSFFVVGVLIIGVVMVNRVADLRQVQSVAETVGVTSVTGESSLGQSDSDSAGSRELDLGNTDTETADATVGNAGTETADATVGNADTETADATVGNTDMEMGDVTGAVEAGDAVTVGSNAAGSDLGDAGTEANDAEVEDANADEMDVSSADSDSADASSSDNSDASDSILTGSDAFWADDEALDTATASESASASGSASAVSENASATDSTAVASDMAEESNGSAAFDRIVGTADETTADSDLSDTSDTSDEDDSTEVSSRQIQAAYVIREGDTLAEICAKYYGSLEYLEALCEANEIEDANLILPGQKIVLP